MKIIVIGAAGAIGSQVIKALSGSGHELISVGKTSGDSHVDIADRESIKLLFKTIGTFDALINAAGDVAFKPLRDLTDEHWKLSLGSKLMGQIQLVQEAIPHINENGSFTLTSGCLSDEPILAGVAASVVNRALEGFVMASAGELPKNLRINVVSPGLLKESEAKYGPAFPGFVSVDGWKVGQAFKKSVLGIQTGQVFRVL